MKRLVIYVLKNLYTHFIQLLIVQEKESLDITLIISLTITSENNFYSI